MKYFKYSLFLASLVLASVSFAQQEAAPAKAQEKTPATTDALPTSSPYLQKQSLVSYR